MQRTTFTVNPSPVAPLRSLLFVDDEPLMGQAFSRVIGLERPDWQVVTATCVADARQALESRRFDAVVADIVMPGTNGLSLLRFARHHYPDMLRVVYSGVVEDFVLHQEVEHADLVFAKPALATRIIAALDELLCSSGGSVPRAQTNSVSDGVFPPRSPESGPPIQAPGRCEVRPPGQSGLRYACADAGGRTRPAAHPRGAKR